MKVAPNIPGGDSMSDAGIRARLSLAACVIVLLGLSQVANAKTLCVNPSGKHGCYSTISDALSHAAANDTIHVGPGTYNEEVDVTFPVDRKSTRLNSSHPSISYAVFCLKKKKKNNII